jgi:hypothetical protein
VPVRIGCEKLTSNNEADSRMIGDKIIPASKRLTTILTYTILSLSSFAIWCEGILLSQGAAGFANRRGIRTVNRSLVASFFTFLPAPRSPFPYSWCLMRTSNFQVVLLPSLEPLARHCTLREAVAFARGYHEVIDRGEVEAAVCPERTRTCVVMSGAIRSSRTPRVILRKDRLASGGF